MKIKLLFAGIILLFLFTRLYKINEIPSSLYWDEASIGYNAYSVLKTYKDEWGNFLPLHFKAFGEYKLPVYVYTTVLSEKIFDLNDWAVRVPAIIFSLISVIFIYLLTLKITKDKYAALLSAFFLTISPWFFIFSRTGYEATAGLAFFIIGLYCFLKAMDHKEVYLLLSVFGFILSAYSYNGFRILSPLVLLTLLVIYIWHVFKTSNRFSVFFFITIIVMIIGILPIAKLLMIDNGTNRLEAVGIFNSSKQEITINFTKNYLSHFQTNFLFNGDTNIRSQISGFGQIYFLDIFLVLFGVIFIIKSKKTPYYLPLVLLLLSPIPAAITRESPHALRALLFAPSIAMLNAFGLFFLYNKISKFKGIFLVAILSIYLILFGNYFKNFISSYAILSSEGYQYAYKQIYTLYKNNFNNYDQIIISDRYAQPYIFALFYLRYDPTLFRLTVNYSQQYHQITSLVQNFDKFIFEPVDFYNFPKGKTLIFAHPSEKLIEIKEKDIIRNPNGQPGLYVYEYQK